MAILLLLERRRGTIRSTTMRLLLVVPRRFVRNIVVCHSRAFGVLVPSAALCTMRGDGLIPIRLVIGLWILQDYVPCMEEAGNISEEAEGNIDDGVGRADADFDPDCVGNKVG